MATGDTAPPIALASSPPPFLGQSSSNLSSPLSDVEDKDIDPDEMDLGGLTRNVARLGTPEPRDEDDDFASRPNSDGESKLSEIDANDSEAETERLYDTPPKNTQGRGLVNGVKDAGGKQFIDRRNAPFEPSPSKLQQQVRPAADAGDEGSDDDSLPDDDPDYSMPSILADRRRADRRRTKDRQSRSPSPSKHTPQTKVQEAKPAEDSTDTRKRKRSSVAEQSELDQPLRKRTCSISPTDHEFSADNTAAPDDEGSSTNTRSGEHTGEEDSTGDREVAHDTKDEAAKSIEDTTTEPSRSRKPKRNGVRRRKSPDDGTEGLNESTPEHGDRAATADEDTIRTGEEEQAEGDVDEEAEVALRNEEELERKKSAWEELSAIEKQFSNFRERLYQERLDQLNQEEAMLTADTPSHPEYLAMLRCIDERREERIRVSKAELQLNMDALKRKAVSERAQIISQYFQSVRESREKVLEALGKEWYEIQHERRRDANHVPDYGIRFPSTKTQCIRHAVAYNKEVSILSGFAKYKGFPAAPTIAGASEDQLDEDFDSIERAKQSSVPPASTQPIHTDIAAGSPFGRSLGAAGEQFLEQTPWANPNHPSHQIQRQHSEQGPNPAASLSGLSGNRRHSHQPGGPSSSNVHPSSIPNGGPPVQMHKSHSSIGHENTKSKLIPGGGLKREAVLQAS